MNSLNPDAPLLAGDPVYVNCRDVRGDDNILTDLGKMIRLSEQMTCQLYTGHRGAGKSTELLRLQEDLENRGFFVVYFEADQQDIDPEDVEYVDILLACTSRLLGELRTANAAPLKDWLSDRWDDVRELAQTKITLDKLDIEGSFAIFTKLTASVKAEPTQRTKIRDKINPHTVTLLTALNEFIGSAKKNLPNGKTQLLVIVDNLDRIPLIFRDNGSNNHEDIFLHRHAQLKGLDCHVIYTVPIAFVYSKWANDANTDYGRTPILPMVMVQTRDGQPYEPGIKKLKEAICRRVEPHAEKRDLETEIFDSSTTIERLCAMSGGHMRELMQMTQMAINHTDALPISVRAVQRAVAEVRDVYRRTVEELEWKILLRVGRSKDIQQDNEHRSLLQRRCILEYRELDGEGELQKWYDIHPLIRGIDRFKQES
ncbi:MAG: ATP-binding protein, partial [Phormidesmis sp. CAN_BIN44]|nr:ATP-binding protein [Phormidesmis sp. CAN_BIN44]